MEKRGEGLITNKQQQQQQQQVIKKGPWKPEEDLLLIRYVETHGEGRWATVSKRSGLMRGGKSCRLRWKNYLSPNLKRGGMSKEEEDLIIRMHKLLGNRWSLIAGRLPGRTDNEIKNYWNTHLRIKMQSEEIKEPKLKKRKLISSSQHCQETVQIMKSSTTTVNESNENNNKNTIMNRPPSDYEQQQQSHHHQFFMSFEGKSSYHEEVEEEEPYRNLVPLLDSGFFIESYGIEVMNGEYHHGKISSSSYLTESLTYISEDLFQ